MVKLSILCLVFAVASCCSQSTDVTIYEPEHVIEIGNDSGVSASAVITHDADTSEATVSKPRSASGTLYTTNPDPVVSLQVDFPSDERCVHTIVFEVIPPDGPLDLDKTAYVTAVVDWMVGGQKISRIVSLANGASISGVGESVKVSMKDATPLVGAPRQTPGTKYTVTAAVAPGTRGSNSLPPTFTPVPLDPSVPFSFATLATSGGNLNVPVPTVNGITAGAVSVKVTGLLLASPFIDVASVEVLQFAASGNTLVAYMADQYIDFVPLHPLCTYVRVINTSAVDEAAVSVVFGIDG